jgi:hypothetical protein
MAPRLSSLITAKVQLRPKEYPGKPLSVWPNLVDGFKLLLIINIVFGYWLLLFYKLGRILIFSNTHSRKFVKK